jgi:alpha-tubulin suppressor-like RCC1 family protein
MALRSDGTVVAWGDNTDANGSFAGESIVPPGLGTAIAIAAGGFHSAALISDTSVMGWGDNSAGQCATPALIGVVSVAAGGEFTLALNNQGVVTGWGDNLQGQYDVPPFGNFVAVAAGRRHSLALFDNGAFQPRLFNAKRSGSQFKVRIQSRARKNYALEYKNSLADFDWNTLSTNRGNGALLLLADMNAAAKQRYYRVREW